MSLIPSANGGTADFPYFHVNRGAQADMNFSLPVIEGSAVGAIRLGDASGGMVLRGDPLTGTGSIRGGASSLSSLILGSSTVASGQMVISDIAVTSIAPFIASGGASVTGTTSVDALNVTGLATFTGAIDMSTTAPELKTLTVAGVVTADTVPVTLPQPGVLSAGLYSIGTSMPANRDRQVSVLGYWDGAIWSIGGAASAISTLGPGNAAIHPAAGGASLTFVQSSGGPLTIAFVYYTQLSAAF